VLKASGNLQPFDMDPGSMARGDGLLKHAGCVRGRPDVDPTGERRSVFSFLFLPAIRPCVPSLVIPAKAGIHVLRRKAC
jgi:hypothetical protein